MINNTNSTQNKGTCRSGDMANALNLVGPKLAGEYSKPFHTPSDYLAQIQSWKYKEETGKLSSHLS